jgi:hypothetical protein
MNAALIDKIADAVLYEGYILYPYRPSTKNRQRWTFGGVFPRAWCEHARCGDRTRVSTECLAVGDGSARLSVKLRFLHLMARDVLRLPEPLERWSANQEPVGELVASLELGGQTWHTWQEATERDVETSPFSLAELSGSAVRQSFAFPAARTIEPLRESDGQIAGLLVRRQESVSGTIELSAESLDAGVWRVRAVVSNDSKIGHVATCSREQALMGSFASTHLVLRAEAANFVSMTDPPAALGAAVSQCRQEGLWPVLVGEAGATDAMLAASIILYDYPQIAPESAGDLFDGTEIDEILSLRILTLSDEEKQAVRSVDARARALLERTESLDANRLAAMHGTVRDLREVRPVEESSDAPVR